MIVPALIMGEKKYSLDRKPLYDYRGAEMAEICQMPGIAINKIINDQRSSYKCIPVGRLVSVIKNAGEILATEILDGESFKEYVAKVTRSTGLPSGVAARGLDQLAGLMSGIDRILEKEVPEHEINILDSGMVSNRWGSLAAAPFGKLIGVIAPSNHPTVHISWITALAMKYSVVVKPGRDDPFTPYRVIHSLLKAGLDRELVSMLPAQQEYTDIIVNGCDRVIFYGTQKAMELFKSNRIIPRGPGNSKIYADLKGGFPEDRALDISMQSVMHDGGRRCTNASSIVVNGDAERFAYKLAEMMECDLRDPKDEKAVVGCFKSLEAATRYDEYIEQNIGSDRDISSEISKKTRLRQAEGLAFLCPTVVYCKSENSLLYGKELPFQFVTVIKADGDIRKLLTGSLAVSLLTSSGDIIRNCVGDPDIGKIIINSSTYASVIGDIHDGFLFNRLYRVKSYLGE